MYRLFFGPSVPDVVVSEDLSDPLLSEKTKGTVCLLLAALDERGVCHIPGVGGSYIYDRSTNERVFYFS